MYMWLYDERGFKCWLMAMEVSSVLGLAVVRDYSCV